MYITFEKFIFPSKERSLLLSKSRTLSFNSPSLLFPSSFSLSPPSFSCHTCSSSVSSHATQVFQASPSPSSHTRAASTFTAFTPARPQPVLNSASPTRAYMSRGHWTLQSQLNLELHTSTHPPAIISLVFFVSVSSFFPPCSLLPTITQFIYLTSNFKSNLLKLDFPSSSTIKNWPVRSELVAISISFLKADSSLYSSFKFFIVAFLCSNVLNSWKSLILSNSFFLSVAGCWLLSIFFSFVSSFLYSSF